MDKTIFDVPGSDTYKGTYNWVSLFRTSEALEMFRHTCALTYSTFFVLFLLKSSELGEQN